RLPARARRNAVEPQRGGLGGAAELAAASELRAPPDRPLRRDETLLVAGLHRQRRLNAVTEHTEVERRMERCRRVRTERHVQLAAQRKSEELPRSGSDFLLHDSAA